MNVLIINIGPHGDVLRTTILLNEFKHANIYWLTSVRNIDILNSKLIKKLFLIENLSYDYYHIYYDLVISLNEEYPFKDDVLFDKLIGVKPDGTYTEDSKAWFDMSLISRLGKEKSNQLKKENKKTYNQIIIEMVGGTWNNQEYIMDYESIESNKIGLIDTVNGVWKSKKWNGFKELYNLLDKEFDVSFLNVKPTVKEHIYDINNCGLIVCPDTFGMHLAIALKKNVIALFSTTSPQEIYDYKRLEKVASPLYDKYFYTKEYNKELSDSIDVYNVYEKIKKLYARTDV